MSPPLAALLKVRLLTAQRGGEVTRMRWRDVDLDAGWWTIPSADTTNAEVHRVPLARRVHGLARLASPALDSAADGDDGYRQRRLETVLSHLRPLRWGQRLQIPFGVLVLLVSVASWRHRWDIVNVRVAAFVMLAYGVALIATGAQTLALLSRLDYAAPVVEIQRQLADVRRWYAKSSLAHGMAWWLLWVPALMMLGGVARRDILARGPWVLGGYTAVCVVGLVVSLVLLRHAERSNRAAVRAWARLSAVGRSLSQAEAALDEIRRFEEGGDPLP